MESLKQFLDVGFGHDVFDRPFPMLLRTPPCGSFFAPVPLGLKTGVRKVGLSRYPLHSLVSEQVATFCGFYARNNFTITEAESKLSVRYLSKPSRNVSIIR